MPSKVSHQLPGELATNYVCKSLIMHLREDNKFAATAKFIEETLLLREAVAAVDAEQRHIQLCCFLEYIRMIVQQLINKSSNVNSNSMSRKHELSCEHAVTVDGRGAHCRGWPPATATRRITDKEDSSLKLPQARLERLNANAALLSLGVEIDQSSFEGSARATLHGRRTSPALHRPRETPYPSC
jgi:hypothetical protein